MNEVNASRHGKIADDSIRICTIFPSAVVSELRKMVGVTRPNVSSVIREYVIKGLEHEQRA